MAMEQPSPKEVVQAARHYQARRNEIIQPFIGQLLSEKEKDAQFASLIDEKKTIIESMSRLARNEGIWSCAYATLAALSGIVSINNFCLGSSLSEMGTCLICGVSIASAACSCLSCCDMCAACDLKNMYQGTINSYLEIKELKPITVIVKQHYE